MRTQTTQMMNLLDTGKYSRRDILLFDMPSGFYGFWNHNADITYLGNTIKAIPGVFSISVLKAGMDLSIDKVTITFGGLDSRVNAVLDDESYHRRPATISVACLDPKTDLVIGIGQWFAGVIDTVTSSEKVGGPTTLTVTLDSDDWELNRVGTRVRTEGDQRQILNTDGSLRYVASAISTPIWWGRAGPVNPKNFGGSI